MRLVLTGMSAVLICGCLSRGSTDLLHARIREQQTHIAETERQIALAPGLREGGVRSSSRSSRPSLSRRSCSARSSSTRFSGITLGRRSASGSPLPRVLLHHDGDVADMSDMRTPARANAKYEGALPRSAAEMPTTLEMKK